MCNTFQHVWSYSACWSPRRCLMLCIIKMMWSRVEQRTHRALCLIPFNRSTSNSYRALRTSKYKNTHTQTSTDRHRQSFTDTEVQTLFTVSFTEQKNKYERNRFLSRDSRKQKLGINKACFISLSLVIVKYEYL